MKILLEQGRRDFEPLSYPARYGLLWEVWFKKLVLRFDLEGRIKEVVVQSTQELLRRTMGNRWLFYEWGNYDQTFALTGAYYLPRDMGEYPYVMGPGFREAATLLGKEMKATDSALPTGNSETAPNISSVTFTFNTQAPGANIVTPPSLPAIGGNLKV